MNTLEKQIQQADAIINVLSCIIIIIVVVFIIFSIKYFKTKTKDL